MSIDIKFDSHQLTIVEIDGVYTKPYEVDELYLSVAQRYTILVSTKDNTNQNFLISATLDTIMLDSDPAYVNPDVFGWLVYNDKKPLPTPTPLRTYNMLDDTLLVPQDHRALLEKVDNQIVLTMNFDVEDGINRLVLAFSWKWFLLTRIRAIINNKIYNENITYVPQKVPTLYTAISAPSEYVSNHLIYGVHSNPSVLKYNDVIEIVLINNDNGAHPWQ